MKSGKEDATHPPRNLSNNPQRNQTMSSYNQSLYQIVFSTKYRKPTLIKENRPILYKFIWGILKNKNCHTYRINGVEDHVHIICSLHPAVSLALLVKTIKSSSSKYLKSSGCFPEFEGWQEGYGAFTYSIDAKANLINYVKNQEAHHKKKSAKNELRELLIRHAVDYDDRYFE